MFLFGLVIWSISILFLARIAAYVVAALRNREKFSIPFQESLRYLPIDSEQTKDRGNLQSLTDNLASFGFVPVSDLEERATHRYLGRLFVGEDGTLCSVSPSDAPGSTHDEPTYTLLTRFQSGLTLCTTNIPHFSTWMDNLPGRSSQLVAHETPFLEIYGHHFVRVNKEVERLETIWPYHAENLTEEILEESHDIYEHFTGKGYFLQDTVAQAYVPTTRFVFAYALGIAAPGKWKHAALGAATTLSFIGGILMLVEWVRLGPKALW